MATVVLDELNKFYPNGTHAIRDINLRIEDGELLVIVGPSGCGKSTVLRMIAGLEDISSGTLAIKNVIMNQTEPAERDIAMVFQNYALYPHMTVFNNMAYGLKNRKLPANEIQLRVMEAATILELDKLLDRKPSNLSGGQRQRVAMGRAIVRMPQVFLFDEPLSNLDAKLRGQMRIEIKKLQRRLNTTTVYVTHDQVEAMTLADRLVVMNNGIAEQIGTPEELYNHPATQFVASFLGSPSINLLEGILSSTGLILDNDQVLDISSHTEPMAVTLGVRAEDLHISTQPDLYMTVDLVEQLGAEVLATGHIKGASQILTVRIDKSIKVHEGDLLPLVIDRNACHWFDASTGLRIEPRLKSNIKKKGSVLSLAEEC